MILSKLWRSPCFACLGVGQRWPKYAYSNGSLQLLLDFCRDGSACFARHHLRRVQQTAAVRAVVRAAVRSRAPQALSSHYYIKICTTMQRKSLSFPRRRAVVCAAVRSRAPPALSSQYYICTTFVLQFNENPSASRAAVRATVRAGRSTRRSTRRSPEYIQRKSLPVAFSYRFHPRFALIPVSFSSPQAPPRFVFAPSHCDPRAMPISSSSPFRFNPVRCSSRHRDPRGIPVSFSHGPLIPTPSPIRFHPRFVFIPVSFSPRGSDHPFFSSPLRFHPRFAFTPRRHSPVSSGIALSRFEPKREPNIRDVFGNNNNNNNNNIKS